MIRISHKESCMGRVESHGKRNPLHWTELEHPRQHQAGSSTPGNQQFQNRNSEAATDYQHTVGTGSSAKISYEPMTDIAVQNFR